MIPGNCLRDNEFMNPNKKEKVMSTELTLKLKLGEKRAVELTKAEAREVYETLKEIFDPKPVVHTRGLDEN